jgi:hypothetical protein
MYKHAHVRLEGCVNRFWTLEKEDGTVEKYYSIEGSPQREGDDARVYDYDKSLGDLLDAVSELYLAVEWDEDTDTVEYSVHIEDDGGFAAYNVVVNPWSLLFS